MTVTTVVRQINEKLNFNIIDNGSGVLAVEREFKGIVRYHVLITKSDGDPMEIAEALTVDKESWKTIKAKYDLPMYNGKS